MSANRATPAPHVRCRRLPLAVAAVVLGLAACSGPSDTVARVTASAGTGDRTTAAAPASATDGAPAGDETATPSTGGTANGPAAEPAPTNMSPLSDPSGPTAPAGVLTAVRWADRGGYDRVVLDFGGPVGGWTVQYVDTLTEDPTGSPVTLAGDAVLAVSIQGATRNNAFQTSDTTALQTYPGPRRLRPGLSNVLELADAGDFEAVLTVGIGVRRRAGFRVLHLTGPERIVVDVAH